MQSHLCKYLVEQQKRMSAIYELVRRNLQASAEMQQRSQIKSILKMRVYYVGQQVWWFYSPMARLKYLSTGPYEVTDVTKTGMSHVSKAMDMTPGSTLPHRNQL